MPHATDVGDTSGDNPEMQGVEEELTLGGFDITELLLNGDDTQLLRELGEGEEKAPDAVDYGDLSDDDLPDEESEIDDNAKAVQGPEVKDPSSPSHLEDDMADLFGEDPNPPAPDVGNQALHRPKLSLPSLSLPFGGLSLPAVSSPQTYEAPVSVTQADKRPKVKAYVLPTEEDMRRQTASLLESLATQDDKDAQEQARLLSAAKDDWDHSVLTGAPLRKTSQLHPGAAPEVPEDIDLWYPGFRQDEPPHFHSLMPSTSAHFRGEKPNKPPKPIFPSKVNLEPDVDHERLFKLKSASMSQKRLRDESVAQGIVFCVEPEEKVQQEWDDDIEMVDLDDDEELGGVTVADLRILCEDWSHLVDSDAEDEGAHAAKRRKLDNSQEAPIFDAQECLKPNIILMEQFPSLDDPEELTAELSKRLLLDLNDPSLLIDIDRSAAVNTDIRKMGRLVRRDAQGSVKSALAQKFNIANDESYTLLKDNHSNRVRSTLTDMNVEHSMPALRLQYPFYKVKLTVREERSFHRPAMHFAPNQRILFEEPARLKLKNVKGKPAREVFSKTKDLTLADNSHAVLMEYSEECPPILNNFGMGSRLVNYYRRKDETDTARPKLHVGETQVLLPQDKSPFSIFGDIPPGEIVPTLHNAMYRSPVFKHDPKPTDFLVIRTRTGKEGTRWFLRNIDHLFTVGQEFPSIPVFNSGVRRVGDISKVRMKMIAFRIYKKKLNSKARQPWLTNEELRQHILPAEHQNSRGKVKEFMAYNKETGSLVPLAPYSDSFLPDEETFRTWIKPEEICSLDSMQMGARQLADAGFEKINIDGKAEDMAFDELMAPWATSKHFLEACTRKSMVELHGRGDPSGRGEAFSFIKCSMKGGFKPLGESVEDKLDAKRRKDNGGHSYNVARQTEAYEFALKHIWNAQLRSLSSTHEHELDTEVEDQNPNNQWRSEAGTPAAHSRLGDESASQISRQDNAESTRVLRIVRTIVGKNDKPEQVEEIIHDRRVINAYIKRRREMEAKAISLEDLKPTGDPELDKANEARLMGELSRLEKNKDRRMGRERMKGKKRSKLEGSEAPGDEAGYMETPSGSYPMDNLPGTPGEQGSQSKEKGNTDKVCTTCGIRGHIKTNKKLCPMLNGTIATTGICPPDYVMPDFDQAALAMKSGRGRGRGAKADGGTTRGRGGGRPRGAGRGRGAAPSPASTAASPHPQSASGFMSAGGFPF
ncbi:hypothetical protein EJ06DRAFT_578493 [Trichodelitschia bisporula]|uniref:Transcription initiation factor TFIID subunit 1 histone acetyltransferase domain-containing protein n=1 Tax=Trichodelitschia bisporula TaxID=703511 RepID=A0A6G1IAI5_9PEZI|nr:hypothetical protein EJ06DRAFT_578493 [Trichodelitschia bisporula]